MLDHILVDRVVDIVPRVPIESLVLLAESFLLPGSEIPAVTAPITVFQLSEPVFRMVTVFKTILANNSSLILLAIIAFIPDIARPENLTANSSLAVASLLLHGL